MRKSGLICLAFFLLLAVWAPCAQAAEETDVPEFRVESVTARPGATVNVSVTLRNNPGIAVALLGISYDSKLTLSEVSTGDAFPSSTFTFTPPGKLLSPCNFLWDTTEVKEQDIKNGTILTLTFQVSESAIPGETLEINISCDPENVRKSDLSLVNPKMTGGAIRVRGDASETVSITQADIEAGTGTFQIFNPGARLDGYAIVSEYLENGKIAETQLKQISIDTGTNSIQFEGMDSSKQYKFFMLNAELTPLCRSLKLSQNHTEGGKLIE